MGRGAVTGVRVVRDTGYQGCWQRIYATGVPQRPALPLEGVADRQIRGLAYYRLVVGLLALVPCVAADVACGQHVAERQHPLRLID